MTNSGIKSRGRAEGEAGHIAKCALIQTWPVATLQASSLCARGSAPVAGNNSQSAISFVASFPSAHEGHSRNDMRVAANHKQDLETCLSTCTEPCIQGVYRHPLEIQLMGFHPHTTTKAFAPWNSPNPPRFRCRDRFLGQSGQSDARLSTAKDRPLMRAAGGVPWRSTA